MERKMRQWMLMGFCVLAITGCAKSTSKTEMESGLKTVAPSTKLSANAADHTAVPDYQKAALINVELGLGYLQQGQVARAKMKLAHAIKLASNISETHTAMAYFLEMIGEYKDAEREHKKSLAMSGKNSSSKGAIYNNYGAFLCRRDRFKEADQAFHQALLDKEYARTAEVYENAGLCAIKSRDEDKAAEYLTTSLRRDPGRANALLALVDLDLKQGKLTEARDLLGRYKTIAEPSARSLWLGILVGKALKDDNTVASQALLLKNLFSDSPEYQLYLKSENNQT